MITIWLFSWVWVCDQITNPVNPDMLYETSLTWLSP